MPPKTSQSIGSKRPRPSSSERQAAAALIDLSKPLYKIEAILGERINKRTGIAEVKVKWIGYKTPSWIPRGNLELAK